MPEKGSILEFKNFKHSMHVPIVVYADFECPTKPIERFVKVWKKYVVNKEITLYDYKNCLFSGRQQLRPMNVIRSHHHEVFTEQMNTIALSPDDNKRIILPNRINTLAHDFRGWGQGDRQRCWETQRDPGEDKGPWGTGAKGLKECLRHHQL